MTFIPPAPANHRNSGVVVLSTGLVSVNAQNDTWGGGSKIGSITLGSTYVTELKVGTTGLNERHTLFLTNDSSKLFYIKATTTLNSSDAILVNSGVAVSVKVDPTQNEKFYGITFAGSSSAIVKIMETKN